MTVDEFRDRVALGEIETVVVGFTDHYGRLLGKRYDAGWTTTKCSCAGAMLPRGNRRTWWHQSGRGR